MTMTDMQSLRENFVFASRYDLGAFISCVNCDDEIEATNIDQVVKWAKRHLRNCAGLAPESDLSEIDPHGEWYTEKEILSDDLRTHDGHKPCSFRAWRANRRGTDLSSSK